MDVNVRSVWFCMKGQIAQMSTREGGGMIRRRTFRGRREIAARAIQHARGNCFGDPLAEFGKRCFGDWQRHGN